MPGKRKMISAPDDDNADAKKRKFEAAFDNGKFAVDGRSAFNTAAKKITVNQNPNAGRVQDRRHILHYDEVLKPCIERVMTNLFLFAKSEEKVAEYLRKALEDAGVNRLPKANSKLFERLVTEMNSVPSNLVPDRADTNKAIEVVRGYLRKYQTALKTAEFAEDARTENHKRMNKYKEISLDYFSIGSDADSDISKERNRIHKQIRKFISGTVSPSQLWVLVHDLIHSVTFDFSPQIAIESTKKAIAWQGIMRRNEGAPALTQLKDLVSLLD